jgi:hypothetical protein
MAHDAWPMSLTTPVRRWVGRLRRRPRPAGPAPAGLDWYCTAAPSPRNALDIFRGEWLSILPAEWGADQGGVAPLFADDRVTRGLERLGGVAGQSVLELGPLEGGHSWMLERAGAASVTAVEANTRAFLKCLVVKELFGLRRTTFLCGDFVEYLRRDPPRFDLVLASGVLYHLRQPAELIALVARVTDRVLIWTHYYDEAVVRATPRLAAKFPGSWAAEYGEFRHRLHRQVYDNADSPRFCGGPAPDSHWMTRSDLLAGLNHFGFDDVAVLAEEAEYVHGPHILIAARRTVPAPTSGVA